MFSSLMLSLVLLNAEPEVPKITMTGMEQVQIVPDESHLLVGVVTKAETVAAANSASNAAMKKLLVSLNQQGIERKDIQTHNFSMRPDYVYARDQEPKLVGYVVHNQLEVTVCQIDKTGDVLDAVIREGANQIEGVSFGRKDNKTFLDTGRQKAAQNAQQKAALYAETLGVKLGPIYSVVENISQPSRGQEVRYGAQQLDSPSGAVPVSGGQLTYNVNVTIQWEIISDVAGRSSPANQATDSDPYRFEKDLFESLMKMLNQFEPEPGREPLKDEFPARPLKE